MSHKLHEVLKGFTASAWVSAADFDQYMVAVTGGGTSPNLGVTIQLRKATSSGGANAANHGDAVTADNYAAATARSDELGATAGGVPYTHFGVTITDEASPNAYTATVVAQAKRAPV